MTNAENAEAAKVLSETQPVVELPDLVTDLPTLLPFTTRPSLSTELRGLRAARLGREHRDIQCGHQEPVAGQLLEPGGRTAFCSHSNSNMLTHLARGQAVAIYSLLYFEKGAGQLLHPISPTP